jgi:hypothetical protein
VSVRGFSLVVLLLAVAIGGYVFSRQAQTVGPTSQLAQRPEASAEAGVAGVNFQGAVPAMEAFFSEHTTYAGATLPPSFGVFVVRADAVSYCLQTGTGSTAQHLSGPGGTPAAGPC